MKVSVLMPTFRRLEFLKRAVDDVFSQTFTDWELVISDDEEGEGETWRWLKELAAHEPKVRIVKNAGPKHGQVHNVNNGIAVCRGEWIKILFDDDGMLPDCLTHMMRVADAAPTAVMIGCRAQQWRNGVYCGDEKDYSINQCESISSQDCRLAIVKYDRWNGRTPTHMLIRRSALVDGAFMADEEGLKLAVDWTWFARILDRGDYVMIRDVLVQQREGEVASLTGGVRDDIASLDKELFIAYKLIFDGIPESARHRLFWRDVRAEINGIRGVYHLRCGHFKTGICMVAKSLYSLRGVGMVIRWFLQETFPGCFVATERVALSL